jgi:hypothetical protein
MKWISESYFYIILDPEFNLSSNVGIPVVTVFQFSKLFSWSQL